MLNFDALNKQLQKVAFEGSFEQFEKMVKTWEEFHGEKNYPAFTSTFLGQTGVLDTLLKTGAYGGEPELVKRKKLKLILDLLQKYGFYLENAKFFNNHALPNNTNERVYSQLPAELLDHPVVAQEMAIDYIRQHLLLNQTQKAVQKFKEINLHPTRVFTPTFFGELVEALPQASKMDKLLTDLNSQGLLPVSVVLSMMAGPFNAAALVNYPKFSKTDLIAMMTAMATLSKEEYADGKPSLVALRLIDQCVAGNAELATELLSYLQNQWGGAPLLVPADVEGIILALLDNGAEILPLPGMAGMYPLFNLMISVNMFKALAHPKAIEKFKALGTSTQHDILSEAGKYDQAGVIPSQTDVEMMKILCPHAQNFSHNQQQAIFDVAGMINVLNAWQTTPHDLVSHERFLKIQGLLLEHGLVDGIEAVQPGSHPLMFNNLQTAMPYDLYQFIMDNPALHRGFRKPQRNEELLSLYGLTKAILAQETRDATELQKVRHYAGFRETTEKGDVVVYNRYDVKEQMQNTQNAIRASIMKWVDPARDIPAQRRQVTAQNLETIARQYLPQAQPQQDTEQDAKQDAKSKAREKLKKAQ